jgi:hypothetical protein
MHDLIARFDDPGHAGPESKLDTVLDMAQDALDDIEDLDGPVTMPSTGTFSGGTDDLCYFDLSAAEVRRIK